MNERVCETKHLAKRANKINKNNKNEREKNWRDTSEREEQKILCCIIIVFTLMSLLDYRGRCCRRRSRYSIPHMNE